MKFGEYTVLEEIGHGASGFVYKVARDENEYAIKACIGFDHESRKRFDREIRLAQALQHPNIVKVYNFDMMASNPYFVMELCHSTLDKIAASLTFNEQVACALQICQGIKALHDASIIHRDIKPSNILVEEGVCKITDFSFGFFLDHNSTTVTSKNQIIGTQGYIAPEIYDHGGHEATIASDIYALGCTLFYIFSCGHHPEHYDRKLVHPAVVRIIEKCRETRPDARYVNVQEVIEELQIFQTPLQFLSIEDLLAHKTEISNAEFRLSAYYLLTNETSWGSLIRGILAIGANSRIDLLKNIPEAGDKILLLLESIRDNDHDTWRQYEDIDPFTEFCSEVFATTNNILAKQKAIEIPLKFAVDNRRWPAMRIIKDRMLANLKDNEIRTLSGFFKANRESLEKWKTNYPACCQILLGSQLVFNNIKNHVLKCTCRAGDIRLIFKLTSSVLN